MHIGPRGPEFDPDDRGDNQGSNRELTVGPMMLAALGLGLVALCAVCFITGYGLGHGASPEAAAAAGKEAPSAAQLFSAQPKPSATQTGGQAGGQAQATSGSSPAVAEAASNADAAVISAPPAVIPAALPAAQSAPQQQSAPTQSVVHSALPQTGYAPAQNNVSQAWMVQIAAVANGEDAEVLVSALRRRSFNVSVRRDAVDNLLHVQVGPFGSHAEAAAMRQRLLDAGYNAIIQP